MPLPVLVQKSKKAVLLLVLMSAVHAGSTKMVTSWFSPDAKTVHFRKVLAVVTDRSVGARKAAEDELVRHLVERGNDAQASYEILSEEQIENPESAKEIIRSSGADGILALRLHTFENSQNDQPYTSRHPVPRTYKNSPDPIASEFTFFSPAPNPGTVTYSDFVIEIEALVYSVESDKLLWRGVTRTKNPMGTRIVVQEIAETAAKTMKRQGLIKK